MKFCIVKESKMKVDHIKVVHSQQLRQSKGDFSTRVFALTICHSYSYSGCMDTIWVASISQKKLLCQGISTLHFLGRFLPYALLYTFLHSYLSHTPDMIFFCPFTLHTTATNALKNTESSFSLISVGIERSFSRTSLFDGKCAAFLLFFC